MSFNLEDKITFEELAPSLQAKISDSVDTSTFSTANNTVTKLFSQLGENRVSITDNLGNIANPVNNREIAFNVTNDQLYSYAGGWKPSHGVYA